MKENDRKTTKMKTVNSSKSQRVLEFVPSIRPSFLSVVLVLVCGCLWVKNEATNERLISLESRIYCVPCTKRGTIDNLDRMTFSATKDIAIDLSKKMQAQVSDDGNGYSSGKIYSANEVEFINNVSTRAEQDSFTRQIVDIITIQLLNKIVFLGFLARRH